MLLNSVGQMNMYEKEQDAGFNLYQKAHPGSYPHDFDPMSFEMTKVPMPLQFHHQQKAQHEPRRERKKLPVEEHEHWVALVWTESNKKPHLRSSSNMKYCRGNILDAAVPKFSFYVNQVKAGGFGFEEGLPYEAALSRSSKQSFPSNSQSGPRTGEKRRRYDFESSDDGRRPPHQQRDDDASDSRSSDVYYRADDKTAWSNWFYNAFRAVQQQACRTIAKEWIKTIHPKKQSTHPYNGKNPKTGERGDPASTKPPYWPENVKHKEPDHINKEDRTQLLVHLLMSTPHVEMSISGEPRSTKEITAEMLKEPLDTKKHENVNKELLKRFHIVQSIIEVRTQIESFEAGGIAGDSMISAPDYSGYNRGTRAEDESDEIEDDEIPEAADSNDTTDDTDGHTELASEDADYVLLNNKQAGPPRASQGEAFRKSERRKAKSRQRHGSRAEDAQTSFMSARSNAATHSLAPQQSGVNDAASISPEWHQLLRQGKADQHAIPPPHMYTAEQLWRHPMGLPVQAAPFPEHGLISPPPQHHMNAVGLSMGGVALADGRFIPDGPYCHPPMHSGSEYMRHPEYADMHDPRGIAIRSPTPQGLFMGHPTPPMNPGVDRVYY